MTPAEFGQWCDDLAKRLPSVGSWIAAHSETVQIWQQELLHDLELADCLAVNQQLMREGHEIKPWDMDRLGAKIRAACKQMEWERHQHQLEREERARRQKISPRGSMAEALRKALQVVDPDERREIIDRELTQGLA